MQHGPELRLFAAHHVGSGDIDPVYLVLRHIERQICATPDEAVMLTLLYVAYYDLASALTTWLEGWRPGQEMTWEQLKRPTGTERRAHRDPKQFVPHLHALGAITPKYIDHLRSLGWYELQIEIASWRGNGRWAAYKTGEMLGAVNGWDVEPLDAGHANSSGPRQGLLDVYPDIQAVIAPLPKNSALTIKFLDTRTDELVEYLGYPVAQVETILCDWHSTLKAHYYVGHDIDLMLEQTWRAGVHPVARGLIMAAREHAFAPTWLGEANDWSGVRKALKRLWVDHQEIVWWH